MQASSRFISSAPRSYLFGRCAARRFSRAPPQLEKKPSSNPTPIGGFGGMSPPRLPKEEQELFEALQKQSTGAFSTSRSPLRINQSPDSTLSDIAQAQNQVSNRTSKLSSGSESDTLEFKRVIEARGIGEELHPNVRRGAAPEFEGDVNPKTGEVGGPKNEPLRWGAAGEWAYNGRTTDF